MVLWSREEMNSGPPYLYLVLLAAGLAQGYSQKEEGQPPEVFVQEGVVEKGNFTRFELRREVPLRIVLQSVEGDADLYVSYRIGNLSYFLGEHDVSSVTCGLDYIDVPATPRPAFLGIYGHPSHKTSKWRLMVIPGKNSTYTSAEFAHGPETIYDWDSFAMEQTSPVGGYSTTVIGEVLFEIIEIVLTVLLR